MASNADILVNFQGIDNVSPVAQQIQGNMGQMGGGIRGTLSELGGIFTGLNGLVMGVFGTMGLSTFKNMTYGTATAREQIKQLYESVAGSTKDVNSEAYKLWDMMDDLTNHGYVSLDQLGQAINVLGLSTTSTVEQMSTITPVINEIGNRAILMGYDANRTQLLMNSVAQGLNGNTRMLNQAFGITKDRLKELGWKGTATDVDGYTQALKSYLGIGDEVKDNLDNTQGKVIALQKRFRIAGRNLGNYMLPPINAIMDGFTQLNEQSNDLLASLIIIGTGAMSGFASILPTLAPLISTYEFLERRVGGSRLTRSIQLFGSETSGLPAIFKSVGSSFNSFVFTPVFNRLKQLTVANTLSGYFTNLSTRLGGVNQRLFIFGNRTKAAVLSPFISSLTKVRDRLSQVTSKLTGFLLEYSSFDTKKGLVDKIMGKGLDPTKYSNNADVSFLKRVNTTGDSVKKIRDNTIFNRVLDNQGRIYREQNGLISVNNMRLEASNILHGINTEMIGLETLEKEANLVATSGLTFAEMARADQQAITAVTTLYNAGVIDAETLAKEYNAIVTGEQTAMENVSIFTKIKNTLVTIKNTIVTNLQAVANGELTISLIAATIAEYAFLAPIILITAAIIGLILVIDQIGKTLGWWDDWKTMLDAIVSGLKRLWAAFINNPNVQGFIKDLQWIFGQLGKVISDVAWTVLEFFGWEDDGSEVDLVRMIINAFGTLGKVMGDVVNIAKSVFGTLWAIIGPVAELIWWALRSIVCILIGCSPGIVPALQSMWNKFREIFGALAPFLLGPVGIIITLLTGMNGKFFTIAKNLGLSLWNGLNSILAGIPDKVLSTFWTMITNLKQLPNQIFNTAQQIGQDIYGGMDSAVSGLTGGLIHLPGMDGTNNNARTNARTMGNVNKNYNNVRQAKQGHTYNIHEGAIQLDARNLTTKESKQVMINALEGLTTYETVHTKKTAGTGG